MFVFRLLGVDPSTVRETISPLFSTPYSSYQRHSFAQRVPPAAAQTGGSGKQRTCEWGGEHATSPSPAGHAITHRVPHPLHPLCTQQSNNKPTAIINRGRRKHETVGPERVTHPFQQFHPAIRLGGFPLLLSEPHVYQRVQQRIVSLPACWRGSLRGLGVLYSPTHTPHCFYDPARDCFVDIYRQRWVERWVGG